MGKQWFNLNTTLIDCKLGQHHLVCTKDIEAVITSLFSFFFFQEALYAHSIMVLVGINHISLDGHEKFGGLMCVHNILSSGKK